jgi:hypothetical protein
MISELEGVNVVPQKGETIGVGGTEKYPPLSATREQSSVTFG